MKESPIDDENNNKFFDENCLIENDEYYNNIKDSIKCQFCHKILKEPMICFGCKESFCKKCTDILNNKNHECVNPKYEKNKHVIKLLNKLKYLWKNCLNEIKKEDIEIHLKKGCIKNKNPTKLVDIIYRKKQLKKLNADEISKIKNQGKNINHISGKSFAYIIL